jgi:arabinogalactan endo-1,4-beta-galactosidase
MKRFLMLLILLSLLCSICGQAQNQTVETKKVQGDNQQEKMLGIDANYVTAMKNSIFRWRYHFQKIDVYQFFSSKGVDSFRLRLFVKDNGSDSLPYAIATAKLVTEQGMKCSITLFLSSDWSDIGKQPAPVQWDQLYNYKNLSLQQKSAVIRNYTKNTTTTLLDNGIDADLYEIGNEIDYGFCGIFEENFTRQEDISWMENTTWNQTAQLIKAASEGVRSVDPTSQFILHIAHYWDFNFSYAFFTTMIHNDVPLDYLGLSFYPSSGIYNITKAYQGIGNGTLSQLKFKETTEGLSNAIGKPLIISEYAYPSSSLIFGPFGSFNHAVEGYPLTKPGQKAWLKDFLQWADNHSFIAGTFYFSPEFYRVIWGPFSLFTYFGMAKPAVDVFDDFSSLT